MGWSKVGEYVTDILVNGSQESSYNQSSDSDYDVNVSEQGWNWSTYKENTSWSSQTTKLSMDSDGVYVVEGYADTACTLKVSNTSDFSGTVYTLARGADYSNYSMVYASAVYFIYTSGDTALTFNTANIARRAASTTPIYAKGVADDSSPGSSAYFRILEATNVKWEIYDGDDSSGTNDSAEDEIYFPRPTGVTVNGVTKS